MEGGLVGRSPTVPTRIGGRSGIPGFVPMHLIAYALSDGYKSRYMLDTQYAKVGLSLVPRPTYGSSGWITSPLREKWVW